MTRAIDDPHEPQIGHVLAHDFDRSTPGMKERTGSSWPAMKAAGYSILRFAISSFWAKSRSDVR